MQHILGFGFEFVVGLGFASLQVENFSGVLSDAIAIENIKEIGSLYRKLRPSQVYVYVWCIYI